MKESARMYRGFLSKAKTNLFTHFVAIDLFRARALNAHQVFFLSYLICLHII